MTGAARHPAGARRRQSGQVAPIIALFSVLLVGATALAIDLSLNTHTRRSLQNATDAAALAGAQDLPAAVSQPNRQSAAFNAVITLYKQLGQPVPVAGDVQTTIATGAGNDCTSVGTHCHVALSFGTYSATVDTPPVSATNVAYDTDGYVEVNLSHTDRNNLGQAVGFAVSTEHGHSVAYHFAPNQAFGLALYANTYVATGNSGELILGSVYAQRFVNPQSAGLAGFCAGNGGRLVLGAPQNPSSYDPRANPGQGDVVPNTADIVNSLSNCNPAGLPGVLNSTISGTVNQTPANPTDCSNPLAGINVTAAYSDPSRVGPNGPGVGACVADPPLPPPTTNFQQPTLPSNSAPECGTQPPGPGSYWYQCDNTNGPTLSVAGGTMPPGTYVIAHGANNTCSPPSCHDLEFNMVNVSAVGVTIVLMNGATMGVLRGSVVTIDPTHNPDGSPCVQSVDTDCRYPIYSGTGSSSQVFVRDMGSTLNLFGTLYLVAGTMNCSSNAFLQIVQGQAIVGTWNVQSGNHNNPIITYDAGLVAPQTEVLRLAE